MFEIDADYGRNVYRGQSAAQRWVGRCPGLGSSLDHGVQDVVAELAMAMLDAVHADIVG